MMVSFAVPVDFRGGLRYLAAGMFGGLYGVFVSWFASIALVTISQNALFATYFGLLFILLGSIIIWRVYSSPVVSASTAKRPLLIGFAVMVLCSGFFCFIVENNVLNLSIAARVPIFSMLGISVCFVMTFFSLDVVNHCVGFVKGRGSPGIVETPGQVYTILAVSIIMGAIFGFVFGLLDVEDVSAGEKQEVKNRLELEEKYCYPVGAVLGALAGMINQKQGEAHAYTLLPTTNVYDDGI